MRDVRVLLTCEHATNRVPGWLRRCLPRAVLRSHRGWDPGALEVARRLTRVLDAPLIHAEVSRLVVDLNRSPHHPKLFSRYTRHLERGERTEILSRYYHPYRDAVERWIARRIGPHRRVLHLSIHSFTPRLRGVTRRADLGLLYDPARPAEASFARRSQEALSDGSLHLRVRRNYPYRGTDDGLMTALRRRFPANRYAAIELEINQRHRRGRWRAVMAAIEDGLRRALSLPSAG